MQMLKDVCGIVAVILGTYAFLPYIRDVLRRQTKPHVYSWLIWSITQGTGVAGLWYGGGGIGAVELTVGAVLVFFVFLLSIKSGTKNITWSDAVLLFLAICGIAVWWQLNNPVLAVLIVSLVDFMGCVPSMRKSWVEPWSETASSWALFSIANIFAITSFNEYNLLTLTYISTITVANTAVFVICLLRRRKVLKVAIPNQTK